jgi:hypothetical protein
MQDVCHFCSPLRPSRGQLIATFYVIPSLGHWDFEAPFDHEHSRSKFERRVLRHRNAQSCGRNFRLWDIGTGLRGVVNRDRDSERYCSEWSQRTRFIMITFKQTEKRSALI